MRPKMDMQIIVVWHVLLYCFVILYILAGASVFHYLEGKTEIERHLKHLRIVRKHKANFIQHIQRDFYDRRRIEQHLRTFLENILKVSSLENYQTITDHFEKFNNKNRKNSEFDEKDKLSAPKRWTFQSSVLFAFTILTTIGYGNVAPTTTVCQVFTMVYGAFGIPLFLITLADIGRFFKTFIIIVVQKAFGLKLKKQKTERKLLREIGEVIFVAILLLTFIAAGSAVLPLWEHDLTYFNSVYFSYMSLTTIGLGDIVPRRMDFLFPTLIYITIGLWLTTAMVEQLSDVFRLVHYAGRHVSNVKTIKVWLGGHQVSVGSLIQTICRRVGMTDSVSGQINWDKTIDGVLNGEPQPEASIFPWHFADFLEHDPPLIDEDYVAKYDEEKNELFNSLKFSSVTECNGCTFFNNNSSRINHLRLSPPRVNGVLKHTISATTPQNIVECFPNHQTRRRNFSMPALKRNMSTINKTSQ